MKRSFVIATFVLSFFSLAPAALAGSVPTGGQCPYGDGDCASGLCNGSAICVVANSPANPNPSNSPANTNPSSNVTLINPLQGGASLESFLGSILAFVIRIGAIVVVLMLVYIGYLFVVAQGEPAKLTEAKKALLWTIIGALVLLGAVAIKDGIIATVNALKVGG